MKPAVTSRDDDPATTLAQRVNALTHDIEAAIHAIAANDLSQLEATIARQQVLAGGLKTLINMMKTSSTKADPKINIAVHALLGANQRYSALLKHSGRTITLLSLLCDSQSGQLKETLGTRQKRQTWSCEM